MSLDDLAPEPAHRDQRWRNFLLIAACLRARPALVLRPQRQAA